MDDSEIVTDAYFCFTQVEDLSNLGGTNAEASVSETTMGGTILGPMQGSFTRTAHTDPQVCSGIRIKNFDGDTLPRLIQLKYRSILSYSPINIKDDDRW